MSLISLIVVLAVVGVLMWLVNAYVPMLPLYKKLFHMLVIVVVCVWVLSLFRILPDLGVIRVGKRNSG